MNTSKDRNGCFSCKRFWEAEYHAAEIKHDQDVKKYSADIENMYSLCLEDISIHPHRDLKEVRS